MRIALALALALALAACRRPQPSPAYQEARSRHAALLARAPADPYLEPEAVAIIELLEQVPRDSADAGPAAELLRAVVGERKAGLEERARRQRLVEEAGRLPAGAAASGAVAAAPPPGAGPAPAADAAAPPSGAVPGSGAVGDRAPSALPAGKPLVELQRESGGCFELRAPARVAQRDGRTVEAEAWALRDDPACRRAHPEEVDRLVLVSGGKLLEVRDAAEARARQEVRPVEGIRRPDGSAALPEGTRLPPGATVKWQEAPAAPKGER